MDISAIKAKAAEINSRYNPDSLIPFPFEEMAVTLNEVRILKTALKSNISGAIYSQAGTFTIFINTEKVEARQYFTLAHEFGHYFLHRDWLLENSNNGFVDFSYSLDSAGMLLRPDDPTSSEVDITKEREANNFAAELIMPEDKVRELWGITHDIKKCADGFQVSAVAMATRLDRLHLV